VEIPVAILYRKCICFQQSKAKKKNGLDFWLSEGHKLTALTPLAQDLLCAPASQAYVERVFFCVWWFDSR